jgi:hypothetical protein
MNLAMRRRYAAVNTIVTAIVEESFHLLDVYRSN